MLHDLVLIESPGRDRVVPDPKLKLLLKVNPKPNRELDTRQPETDPNPK